MVELAQKIPSRKAAEQEVYVGPRPFERSERGLFFGRDREISELLSLVVSSRVVLCYAPSGAGKTSLINAGLLPRLEQEGFEVLPSTRVRGLIPEGIDQTKVPNLYVFNALLSLAGEGGAPAELAGRSLAEYLSVRPHVNDEDGFPEPRILIFDQFEELLTSYPERWQEREAFFQQVRDALQADTLLRVLFVFREDFLARIEPYVRLLKPFSQARFRLPLLGQEGAYAAVTGPIRGTGRRFKEGVVADLVRELLMVRVETAQGESVEVEGEYVEPVQLQVVCRTLWTRLPPDVQEISSEHVKTYGNVDQALEDFYESCLMEAKASMGAKEPALRQWFEGQLITPAGTRGIVFRDVARTADLPNPIVDFLENRHLIRGEWRAGSRWYELTHDRFIEPIQRANERWRSQRRARRNRWVMGTVATLLLVLAFIPTFVSSQRNTSSQEDVEATVAVAVQSTSSVAVVQAEVAQEDAALSKARQLIAQSQLEVDPQLALLLSVAANQQANTQETRRNLQKILSRQAVFDGKFLRVFGSEILSPRIKARLVDHTGQVISVAFSPDGRRIASGSADSSIILWDVETGNPVGAPLSGHTGNVLSVAFSPDGTLLASAGSDGQILLWSVSNLQRVGEPFLGHTGLVTSIAFSPDGMRLASAGADGAIRIWDVSKGASLGVIRHPAPASIWSVAWSPNGTYLASAGADLTVRLWNANTFDEVRSFSGHQGLIRSLAWSPDGRSLASGSVIEEGSRTGGEVFLWNVETGSEIARLMPENIQPVRTVAFNPTGTILAIGRDDGRIILWDILNEQILGDPLQGHIDRVYSIAFSPDGKYMVSGSFDETVLIWDFFVPTRSIAFSPTEATLATSSAFLDLWDISTEQITHGISFDAASDDDVLALDFSPDGTLLGAAGRLGRILLWNYRTGEIKPPLLGHTGEVFKLDFSPDGKKLVSAGRDGNVLFWDLETYQQQGPEIVYQDESIIETSFDPGGQALYLADKKGNLVTLDLATGDRRVEALPDIQARESVARLAISDDGHKVAFTREDDGERAHGIEITQYDGSFNPSVNPGDIDFIVVQASNGLQKDRNFDRYLESVKNIPIRGAAHFFRPDLPWQEQADLFLSLVKERGFHFYNLQIDWSSIQNVQAEAFARDTELWLKYVDERVDEKILIQTYTRSYETWLKPYGDWSKWPLFIVLYFAEPDRNETPSLPSGVDDWKMWQYTEKGAGYGVARNNAVLSVYNGTLTDLRNWLELPVFTIYNRATGDHYNPKLPDGLTNLTSIALSPISFFAAYGGEGFVTLLDASSGEDISTLPIFGSTVTSLRFGPDGMILAIGTDYGSVILWDLALINPGTDPEPYRALACSLAGRSFTKTELERYFTSPPDQPVCSGFR